MRVQIKGKVISLITAYRVCKINVNLETDTAYSQHWKAWAMKTNKKVDPREQTLKYLKEYVNGEIEKKREVVLLIHANVGPENRTEEMTKLIHGCGLIYTHLLNPYYEIEAYAKGGEKIEFVLMTLRI